MRYSISIIMVLIGCGLAYGQIGIDSHVDRINSVIRSQDTPEARAKDAERQRQDLEKAVMIDKAAIRSWALQDITTAKQKMGLEPIPRKSFSGKLVKVSPMWVWLEDAKHNEKQVARDQLAPQDAKYVDKTLKVAKK